ncbi:hypothetical protein [Thermococcus sp. 9N3]|uniref:hypothetical protein n=1 Tax=Thermococcus sp. 9N3 TaxID=163002 RepID=UPI00142F5837|nr:hypothetical protein [Thermococcus sp. 9N3]NJE48302.1 hypothetical protein [Thermococcus sp. 9N3]
MDSVRLLRRTLAGILVAILTVGLSLAVPDISVKVQPLGLGACQVKSPITWATITLHWSKSGGIIQTWTLTGASVVFSNDVHGEFNFTIQIKIQGYRSFWDSTPTTDLVKGTFSTNSGILAGTVYQLTLNASPNYAVSPFFNFPEPEIVNAVGTVAGGIALCPGEISLVSEGIGTGSTSYSPPPLNVSEIRITVNNTGNPELRNYVINFTVSPSCVPDLSKVYVTNSSGKQLYFWAFNDSTNGKIWFWVNYTVPANSVREIIIHLNGTGTSPYFDPNRVFWNFTENLELSEMMLQVIGVNLSRISARGYTGYVIDTYANLDVPNSYHPGSMFLGFYQYRRGIYYLHGIGINYWVSFSTLSYSYQLGSVTLAGTNPSQLSLWSYSVVNDNIPLSSSGLYSVAFNNLTKNIGLYLNGTFLGSTKVRGTLIPPILGQYNANSGSHYYWIGVRPFASSPPRVSLPTTCSAPSSGTYTFTLYFRP